MSSEPLSRADIITTLNQWEGGFATVWSYSASHQCLEIRFTHPQHEGNLHLLCGGCERISLPARWKHAGIAIEAYGTEPGILIKDEANGVQIHCDTLRIKRNVDPIY